MGDIHYYTNVGNHISPVFNLQTNSFIDDNLGKETVPIIIDIDLDSDLDLVIGNIKGGLYFYRNTLITGIKEEEGKINKIDEFFIKAHPNPFNGLITINIDVEKTDYYSLKIFNILGQEVLNLYSGNLKKGNSSFYWNGKNNFGKDVSTGYYLITILNKTNIKTLPVTLIK
jgi:hypothetical protein